jgi:hypothetical protein
MSNAHLTAARKCSRFKGNARLLLLILADAASNGKPRKDGQPNLPFGWTNKGVKQLKKDLNIPRRQTITDLLAELEHAEAVVRKQRLRQNAMTFVDIEWLKENSWNPEATESVASGTESSGSVTRAGSDPEVHNEKRGICATETVASEMPRKTLPDTTESVATSTYPSLNPFIDLPAPSGDVTRSRVRDDFAIAIAPQVWQEPEAKAAPKAKPEPPSIHRFERPGQASPHLGKSYVCRDCGLSQREYHCSGGANNPANVCPALPCGRSILCAVCGGERAEMGMCPACFDRRREERLARKKAEAEAAAASVSATQIADLLSADWVS